MAASLVRYIKGTLKNLCNIHTVTAAISSQTKSDSGLKRLKVGCHLL